MEKSIIILCFICVLSIGSVYGEEGKNSDVDIIVPPDMETIKKGDINLVIYKGDPLRKRCDVLMPESLEEYTSNKFADTDDRFKKVERELKAQKAELEDIKSAVKKLEEDGRKK